MKIILFLILSSLFFNTYSQNRSDIPQKNFFGGSFGLQFGTITNINVSPHMGRDILPVLSVGLGGSYQYYRDARYQPDLELNIYGARMFARFSPLEEFFAYAEYELLLYETDIYSPIREIETIVSENILLGVGYRQFSRPDSKNSFYLMLLYNANETIYTPYSNPIFRVGMEFYF